MVILETRKSDVVIIIDRGGNSMSAGGSGVRWDAVGRDLRDWSMPLPYFRTPMGFERTEIEGVEWLEIVVGV